MRPNFFIAGAPKCGTTALVEYLRTHPQVFISELKEPHYFATDMEGKRTIKSEAGYEALFEGAERYHRAVGEGSVYYLYSEQALSNIRAYAPQARIIVMLRNPVELIPSLHGQYLYSRNEDERDLATAWALIGPRSEGQRLPKRCSDPKLLRYDRIARLGEQLERLLATFPAGQVMWIFFDDFARDTRGEYLRVMRFLGLDDDGRDTFPPINQHKRHRLDTVGNFTQRPPRRLVQAGLKAKRLLGIERLGLLNRLRRLNRIDGRRAPMTPVLRETILESYRDDILRLSRLTGRPLHHWLEPHGAPEAAAPPVASGLR